MKSTRSTHRGRPVLRPLLALAVALCAGLLAAPAAIAQETPSVDAKLYSKATEDGRVMVAIQVRPGLNCWVYDDDDDAGGIPAVVEILPADGGWTKPWFPEPYVKHEEFIGDSKVHKQRFYIYAVGEGVAPEDVEVNIVGQVCNDNSCLPWNVEGLERRGKGTDTVWEGFPAALLVGDDGAAGDESVEAEPGAAAGDGGAVERAGDDWVPDYAGDNLDFRAFARADGDVVTVAVEIAVAPGYHIYHGPGEEHIGPGFATPTAPVIVGGNADWGDWAFPEPHKYESEGVPYTWTHEGRVVLRVEGEAWDEFDPEDLVIDLVGQVCDDMGCLPFEVEVALAEGGGPDALFTAAVAVEHDLEALASGGHADESGASEQAVEGAEADGSSDGAAKEGGGDDEKDDGLLAFLLLAFGAGLITLLMPCTYPMIPITISFFTKQATARGGNVLPLALAYGAGIVMLFVLIGVAAGPIIVPFAQHWITNIAIGVLFIVFALSLFGVFTLQPPKFLMGAAGKASQQGGYGGVFLMGACLVITSFTCTAPFVGSLLGAGASSYTKIILGMGVFGLTMATPFVLLALVPGKLQSIPQAGGWMETLKVFMGFVEIAASLKFFSNADIFLTGGDYLKGGWLSRELFLGLWAATAVVAAMYLFGRINLKGENPDGNIGGGRLVGGIATSFFAVYCMIGALGYQLGGTMTALVPPPDYSLGLVPAWQGSGGGGAAVEKPIVIKDDYDEALTRAKNEGKLLLANFTGHT